MILVSARNVFTSELTMVVRTAAWIRLLLMMF